MARTRARTPTATGPTPAKLDRADVLGPRERAARALESRAEAGDVAAIRALSEGVADKLREDDPGRDALHPDVAAAMIAAGLDTMRRLGL